MTIHPMRLAALILMAGVALSYYRFFLPYSGDLMATWLAGHFLKIGRPDQVYPPLTDFFIMHPPSEWRAYMAATHDYEGPMFPFIYPPLWAKIAELMSGLSFWKIAVVALALNAILLMATILLAFRASRSALHPAIYAGIALFLLHATHIGTIALNENQPQIFVSFLLVLAIERTRAGFPIAAGLALAIAASIKLYPAIFALFWLFGRERRALLSFVLFGAGLAMTSVLWAGWPLHAEFLDQMQLISRTVLVTGLSFSFDASIAQIFLRDELQWIPSLEPPTELVPDPGWYAMSKSIIWRTLSGLALVSVIMMLCIAFRRASADMQASLLWPLALTVVALLSPISWVYYYIPAACFAPVLIEKLGRRLGGAFIVLGFGPMLLPFLRYYWAMSESPDWPPYLYQIVSVTSLTIVALGFVFACFRGQENAQASAGA